MPVPHTYTMKAGTKSKLLLVYATSGESTSGKTGACRDFPPAVQPTFGRGIRRPAGSPWSRVASANGDRAHSLKSIPSCCPGCINSARRMKCLPKVLRALFC